MEYLTIVFMISAMLGWALLMRSIINGSHKSTGDPDCGPTAVTSPRTIPTSNNYNAGSSC